jgi:hypothetical protein
LDVLSTKSGGQYLFATPTGVSDFLDLSPPFPVADHLVCANYSTNEDETEGKAGAGASDI